MRAPRSFVWPGTCSSGIKPRRVDGATRARLAFLSRWFDRRSALVVVRPETLIRWHRASFLLLWGWKSRAGRPPIPKELRECVAVTCSFRVLYVLVVIEHHCRRLIHFSLTAHPTAQWTRQQLREAVGCEERYAYLLHDRDAIFSAELDQSIYRLGLRVLKSPPRSPKANSICERVIGTLRRECLDWLITLGSTSAPDAKILGGALQSRPPELSSRSRRSRSSREFACSIVDVSASTRRFSLGSCQSNTRRPAPRVLAGVRVNKSTQPRTVRRGYCGRTASLRSAQSIAT